MQKIAILFLFSGFLFAFFGFTIPDSPSEDYFGVVFNQTQPFSTIVNVCGEDIQVEGVFHQVVSGNISGNGNYHSKFHINAKGTGIGLVSGAKYQWNDAINENLNLTQGGSGCCGNQTISQQLRIIGQGSAPNFLLTSLTHVTVNANGDFTVFTDSFTAECK
jgi:hypothetical protein